MKKYLLLLLSFISIISFQDVCAKDYKMMELIPISDTATVETSEYIYRDFSYINEVDKEVYGVLKFDFVKNKRQDSRPLAVDILLFDKNKINIGFVAYCTIKDLKGEYAQITVNGDAGSPLTVFVDNSYLVKGHYKDEIAYVAVLDGNEKCYVGNHEKYAGLTIEEIRKGETSPDWNENDFVNVFSFILNVGIYTFLFILLLIMVLYVLFAVLINTLSKKMFDKKLSSRFIPIINLYHSLNIAFGRIVAIVGMVGIVLSIILIIFTSNWILFYIMIGVCIFSIIINIIKYFTKNYDLLFYDPFIVNDGTNPTYFWKKIKVTGEKKAQQILNLNYSQQDVEKSISPVVEENNHLEFTPVQNKVDSMEQMLQKIDEGTAIVPHENEVVPQEDNMFNQEASEPVVPIDPTAIIENVGSTVDNAEDANHKEKTKEEEFMDMFQ